MGCSRLATMPNTAQKVVPNNLETHTQDRASIDPLLPVITRFMTDKRMRKYRYNKYLSKH